MQDFLPPSPEVRVLTQITESFHLSKDEAETALLLLKARAKTLDMTFDEYLSTYHPKGFAVSDTSLPDEIKGYTAFLSGDARALIGVGKKADFSTFIHESAHVFRRQLAGTLKERAEKAFKVEGGAWSEAQEEAFAIGFEQYIRLRIAASEDHRRVFEKGAAFTQQIYNGLDRIIPLNREIIRVYDEFFTAERFMFNQQRFDEAVETISMQKDAAQFAQSHLYLGMTAPIYQELGFERLPVMITARHLHNIMQPEKERSAPNYHGLTPEMVKQIPDALKKPLLIMQSQRSDSKEDIIAVVSLKDSEGRPIIIPLSPNKKGRFNDVLIDINLAKSIYGRNNFTQFVENACKENRVLYINDKSRVLADLKIQYLNVQDSQLLYENIAAYHNAVKQKNPDIPLLYQKTAYYAGQQLAFDFLNDPIKQGALQPEEKKQQTPQSPHHTVLPVETAPNKKEAGVSAQPDAIKIVNNTALKRVQLFFPDKPPDDVRSDLKAHGWRWSPRNFCWQRLNTENGLADADRIQKKWYPENTPTDAASERGASQSITDKIAQWKKEGRAIVKDEHGLNFYEGMTADEKIAWIHTEIARLDRENKVLADNTDTHFYEAIKDNEKEITEYQADIDYYTKCREIPQQGAVITTPLASVEKQEIELTQNDFENAQKVIPPLQYYMEEKRQQLKREKEYGWNLDSGIPDGQGNGHTEMGDAGRTEDTGRNTGMDDRALERARESADRSNSGQNYEREVQPHSQNHERGRIAFVGGSDEPQNGKSTHRGTPDIGSDQSRNGSIKVQQHSKQTVGAVKRIREQCLTLLNEKRTDELTAEDKHILAQYEGGGGTGEAQRSASGVLYEFYTPKAVCDTLWHLVDAYDPTIKTVLEPAGGTGRFLAGREHNECTLIEPDETASRIARLLHPAAEVKTQAFQELFFKDGVIRTAQYTGKKFDLVIGNPPYGTYSGFYKGKGEGASHSRYEQYFLDRALDVVKDGGLVAFVLPSSFLQSAQTEGKRLIAAKGTLIDAWRLPSGIFPTTDVGVDLVIVKKAKGDEKDFSLDAFFAHHRDHILGEEKESVNQFGRKQITIVPFTGETPEATLARIIPESILKPEKEELHQKVAETDAANKAGAVSGNKEPIGSTKNWFEDYYKNSVGGMVLQSVKDGNVHIIDLTGKNSREQRVCEEKKTQERIMRENVKMAQALADRIPVEADGSFSKEKQVALARFEYLRMHYLTITGVRREADNNATAVARAKRERTQFLKSHAGSKNEYILSTIAHKDGLIQFLEDYKNGRPKDPYREHEALITEIAQVNLLRNETEAPPKIHRASIQSAETTAERAQKKMSDPLPQADKVEQYEGKLLSAREFATKYGRTIDEREAPLWKATDYEGKIESASLTAEQRAFIAQCPDYVKISETAWMHTVNFTKGNIYEKLETLENDKQLLDETLYQKQKKLLEQSLPPEVPYEKLTIPIHSNLAHEFIVARDDNGVPYNLREGFIKWATGKQAMLEADIPPAGSGISRWKLSDESPIRQEELPPEIRWSDIVFYIDREPVRARQEHIAIKKKAAQLEAEKIRTLRRETAERLFNRYIQEGVPEERRSELLTLWNRRFNGYRAADYAKLPLFVSGMSEQKDGEAFTLYEQQIKGISFLTDKGNGLLAYDVGVGKTACGIVATVNQIQAERAHRPLICVPKAVYSKWLHDIKELFPTIPVNDLGNFSEEKLKPFLVGEHGLSLEKDSISLCTHEALQAITFKKQTLEGDLTVDLLDARSTVSGNAREEALEKEKIQKILGEASLVKNGYVYWEDTGFDHITVDEAHRFKNLFTMPRPQYDDGAKRQANEFEGIGSGTPSKRAQKLFAITQLIQKENNGRNVFLLTATPFTNSPTEIYSMLSYIGREKLKNMHLYNLGSFMTEFAQTHTEWAVKPNGEILPKQVMKNFRNVQSLQNLLTEYIDKVDAEEAGVIRPIKRVHAIELEATELQKKIIDAETARLSTISKDDPGGALVAMNNMRMALLSPALVNAHDYDFPLPPMTELVESSPKLTFVCNAIAASYKKVPDGGQVMYMPRGVQEAEEVKRYLIAHGIPENAIGIINSTTSSKKKDEMTAQFNDKTAPLKIIIGSETISEGIDLNGNSFALYNCMLGWNPTESTQVEGRIWRQGNEQGHVHITYPLITDSIDSLMYQKHDEKSSRINALWSYKGDVLDVQDIRPEELKLDLIKDPEKKAAFIISRKKAALEAARTIIDLKLSTIDAIIEKKHTIALHIADAEKYDAKETLRFYKTKLRMLEKKEAACGIDSEHSAAMRMSELNEEKRRLTERIDSIEKEKPRLIAEAQKAQAAEHSLAGSLVDITENYVHNLLTDLKPMAEVKKEIELKRKHNALSAKEESVTMPSEKAPAHQNIEIPLEVSSKPQSVQPIITSLRPSSGNSIAEATQTVSGTVNSKATQKNETPAAAFERAVPSCYARIGGRTLSVQSLAQLQTHFSFRTVASDSSATLKQHEITAVAHAFADMADVLHLPDKQIGVFSTLALSVDGTQQKRSGTHYDRNKQMLSLTHGKSGGLLAEKWFSAFDNLLYSAATGQKKDVCLTEISQGKGKINHAFQNLMTAITEKEDKTPSDYLRHAQLLDGEKAANPYWARKRNLAARAFQAYVSDKLESLGRKNTLLCFKPDNTLYKTRTPAQGIPKPYPEGAERARINKAFDALFDAQRQFLYAKEHPLVAQTVKPQYTVSFER